VSTRHWRLVRFTPGLYALTLLLQLARLSLVLVPGLIVRRLLDLLAGEAASGTSSPTWLWFLAAMLVGTAVARVTVVLGAVYTEQTASFYSSSLLRKNLFAHLLRRVSGDGPGMVAPGEIVSHLEADTRLIAEYLRHCTFVAGTAAGAILAVIIMARIDLVVTVAALLPLLAAGVLLRLASGKLGPLRRAKRAADGQVAAFLAESFGAVQTIKVYHAETRVVDRLRTLNATRRRAALSEAMFRDFVLFGFENVTAIAAGIVLLVAGHAMHAGRLSVGDLALFMAYLNPVADFAVQLGESLAAFRQVTVSWERLEHLIGGPRALDLLVSPGNVYLHGPLPAVPAWPEAPGRPAVSPAAIVAGAPPPMLPRRGLRTLEVRELSYRYPGTARGIAGISFRLEGGTLTVVTGRVGAGKTTLLRVLLGLLPLDEGEIRWNGEPVPEPAAVFVPPRCAYTPQVPRLFSGTLRENILLGLPASPAALRRALRLAVLEPDVAELPRGLDTLVGPRGVRLSGGQLQRTAAARMLVREPELLVVDDLSSALDVETERTLWEGLLSLRPPPTILAVSHRPAALRRADQVIALR
jgi:ATP-binding cassette subfamily B protein